jgi:hypothetical protein
MLAVTTRVEIKTRLVRVAGEFGLPMPEFFAHARDALASRASAPLVFLDLGICCRERGLRATVGAWARRHPLAEVILFVPLLDRECETHAMFELAALGVGRVMTVSDLARAEVWHTIRVAHGVALLQREMLEEFRDAVRRAAHPVRAVRIVEEMLTNVHTNAPCCAMAGLSPDRAVSAGARRKAVWSALRREGQMPASWLVLTFRVLWYAKLREQGWDAQRIAAFLGFRTPRLLRMTLKRRFGVCMRELQEVRYAAALRWAVELCTGDHGAETGRARERLPYPPLQTRNKPDPHRNEPAPLLG